MFHFILLLISFVLFISGTVALTIMEARFNYQLSYPELKSIRNGIKWIREHDQRVLYRFHIIILYFFSIMWKIIYMIAEVTQYGTLEYIFLVLSLLCIPMLIFPLIHDMVYDYEYQRLANVSYEDQVMDEEHKRSIVKTPPGARIGLFILAIFMFCIQTYIIFHEHIT